MLRSYEHTRRSLLFLFLLTQFLWSAGLPSDTRADEKTITIAYPAKSMSWFPIYVAEKRGFFRDEGLRPVMVLMRSGITTTALATQQIDYTTNGSALLTGALKRLPLRVLMGLANRTLFSLVVVPEIKSVQDLKGKVIGVNAFGGTQAVVSEEYLRNVGLEPGKSVQLLALGDDAARMAAMEKRLIHATLLPPPGNVYAEKQGYRILVRADEMAKIPQAIFGTHLEKVRRDRDEVVKVITAIVRGHRFVQREPEGAVRLVQEWNQLNATDARRVYELSKGVYAEDGRVEEKGIQTLAEVIEKSAGGPMASVTGRDIFDPALVGESIDRIRK
jgi:NitT/TauT family transport system substrate-binding protein